MRATIDLLLDAENEISLINIPVCKAIPAMILR
jgi:hypothetical protein